MKEDKPWFPVVPVPCKYPWDEPFPLPSPANRGIAEKKRLLKELAALFGVEIEFVDERGN